MWVAGVDGCPAGWLVVFRSVENHCHKARIVGSLVDVFLACERPKVAAVDIPIGLLSISKSGGRVADKECRKVLGRYRQSSIFPPPSRATINATSFLEACEIELANSVPPKKVNQQTFNIMKKIREADAIALRFQGSIFECHPEVSFWAMNNRLAMRLPKKGSRKADAGNYRESGSTERRELLIRNGYSEDFLATRLGSAKQCSSNDFIDACAAAWTARRILKGEAIRFPSAADFDDRGLDMAIWA
jgi:predicted RNase H-like nuclease